MLHIFSSKTYGHKTYIEGNLNFHSDLQKIHLRSTHSTVGLLIVQSLPHKSFQALSFHVFPKIPWIFEREITKMVCPGKKCAFSKACSTYLQNPAQCIFKSQSCTILSWASLVLCKQGDAHLEMQICSRYWNCNQKLFLFQVCQLYFFWTTGSKNVQFIVRWCYMQKFSGAQVGKIK